jgi:iron complex outermembrane receptor protein
MKNHNLLIAFLLALPLFIVADAPMDVAEEAEADVVETTEEEEVVVDEQVSSSSSAPFVSDDDVEEVVVTGSRIKKSTFTSIAPLQILNTEISREAGLIDAADILQESPTASGQQIDL